LKSPCETTVDRPCYATGPACCDSATANAANPHFTQASADLSGTNLVVSFKETGLGNNAKIDYTASANASATIVCVNNGAKNPSAQNKTFASGLVTASATFNSDKNGNISKTLTILPPSAENFTCPPGQSQQTAQVVYTNVEIKDTTTPVTAQIPGTFDTGCLLMNVRGACSS
jgi:hypothetical protein